MDFASESPVCIAFSHIVAGTRRLIKNRQWSCSRGWLTSKSSGCPRRWLLLTFRDKWQESRYWLQEEGTQASSRACLPSGSQAWSKLPTQPGNQWEHPRPRLGSGPILPTQRMTTIPLTPTIPHILSTKHSFFFFFSSLILYFHHPLSILPGPLCSMRVFGMLRASQGELSIIQSELVFHVH